ncbi:CorA family divalent cation transporter [Streptomyces sp. CNQ085]|uniref:CorA family divalent cation transporter n=1 Tax=Streptomyces sp. CNQ085 TaxID=2886944 RepID=UPI0035B2A998
MIVDCAIYRAGRRAEGPSGLTEAFRAARSDRDAFVWIGLYEPAEEEFEQVSREFGLHPLAVEDARSAYLARVGVRQNDDMRKISAWAAMAAVPTMIAGVYGMNFDHMPEPARPLGCPGVVVLMVTVSAGLYRLFKRRGRL